MVNMNKAKQELKEKIITAIKEYEVEANILLLSKVQSIDFFVWGDQDQSVTLQINYKQNGMRI